MDLHKRYKRRVLHGTNTLREKETLELRWYFENVTLKTMPSVNHIQITDPDEFTVTETTKFCDVVLEDITNNDKKALDEKNMYTKIDENVDVGCYLFFDNSFWLVIFKEHKTIADKKHFIVRRCNQFINHMYNGKIYRIPVSIENLTINYMSLYIEIYIEKLGKIGKTLIIKELILMSANRDGLIFKSNQNCLIKVIKYINCEKVLIEFQDDFKYRRYVSWNNLINGKVKNPYFKSVYGVGYLGVGKYKSRENYKITKEYKTWQSMLQRCYDKKHLERDNSYIGCTVDKEWHNFQNFAKWYNENYYEIEGKKICLDKDIKFKNNKIYSKDKCSLIPEDINLIFATHKSVRNGTSIGVVYDKKREKYIAHMIINNKFKNLGYFNDYETAFYTYKNFKEKYIKQKADLYKNYLDKEVYESLINWKIEISD